MSDVEKSPEEKQLIEKAESLSDMTLGAMANGELDRALGFAQESKQLYEQISRSDEFTGKQGVASALTNIAHISLKNGELDLALAFYQESLGLYEQLKAFDEALGKQGAAASLSQLANVHWEKGDSEQARHFLELAIETGKEAGDLEGTAFDTTKLGQLRQAHGDNESALVHYREGLKLFEKLDIQEKVDELKQMIASLEESIAREESQADDELAQAIAEADRAVARGDIKSAIEIQEQVVSFTRGVENQKVLIVQMVNLAQYYAMEERFDDAVSLLDETLKIGEAIEYPELNTVRQLHKTISSVASLPPEEKAAARAEQRLAQIAHVADQAREAGLAYVRKQAPKSDVVNWFAQAVRQLKEDKEVDSAILELVALCEALSALIKGESVLPVPEAYKSHFSAVQSEMK